MGTAARNGGFHVIALAGYVSSFVTMVSSLLGFVALFAFTLVLAPLGAVVCLFYAARSVFDETEFNQTQSRLALPSAPQPI